MSKVGVTVQAFSGSIQRQGGIITRVFEDTYTTGKPPNQQTHTGTFYDVTVFENDNGLPIILNKLAKKDTPEQAGAVGYWQLPE